MGFYVTGSASLPRSEAGCERREKTHPPSKNRVWDFFATSHTCAGQNVTFAQYPRPENEPTPTATASGARYYGYRFYSPGLGRWIGRDPLGERGGLNIYSFAKNAPNLFLDYLGLADVSIAMGPDLHMWVDDTHTSVKGTARALWGQNNIQMIANIAQSEFDEENQNPDAKPCNLSIQWFVSSDANPMSLESLKQNLSSVSSDLLIYIGHGAVVDGETKTPLFTSWQIAPTPTVGGVAIGKLYSFGEIFQGVQYEDPPPKQLAVSCCYSAYLPKKAGGFKVYRIAPTEMQPNPILPGDIQGNMKILFKKLCCKKTAAEAGQ